MKQEELDKLLKDKLEGLNFEYTPAHWALMQERMHIESMDADDPSAFDATMKGKLENIAPEYNPLHWEMMQASIAAEGLTPEADPIDAILKSRLENITPDLNPVHWEMMKDAMGAEGMSVELDPVDELLKGKLENIEYAYNPSHWEVLKERIDQEAYADAKQVDDVLFDATTYGHLSNMEFPYNEEHWELMKERIDAEFSIRGKMIRYKVAEVALILMIIITAFHYLPIHKKKMKAKAIANAAAIENTISEIAHENKSTQKIATTSPAPSKQTQIVGNNIVTSNSLVTNNTSSNSDELTIVANDPIESTVVTSNEMVGINNGGAIINDDIVDNNSKEELIVVAPTSSFDDTPIIKTEDSILNDFPNAFAESIIASTINTSATKTKASSIVVSEGMTQLKALKTLQTSLLDIEKEEAPVGCRSCTKLTQKWELSVGMFSTFDYNYVMTPYDNVFESGSYAQSALGYGGGFSIGLRHNKWEVETGVIYSYKQYAPKPRIEIFRGNISSGYVGESINDVELNMVQIPLNLKYHFYQKGKWNIYASGGANLNMAMQANYDKKQYFFGGNGATGGANSFPTIRETEIAVSQTTAQKRFADGILGGGSFIENRYFSANLGFGVERKFNPRWSIFGQPTYQHQLLSQGLGPNKDRINSLSILTGARVSF